MNKFIHGITTLSLTALAFFQADNANAEANETEVSKNTPIETTSHGCGCACGSCTEF